MHVNPDEVPVVVDEEVLIAAKKLVENETARSD